MWHQLILISVIMAAETISIFNFSSRGSTDQWQILNDGVMGGLSQSSIELTKDGYGLFSGHVSTKNNGGFASVRLPSNVRIESDQQEIILRIKGDGKTYQCRLKGNENQRESYVHEFDTNGEWQTLKLKISDFYPQYRGRKLDRPNFNFDQLALFGFLITSKKETDFELLIDRIDLE